MVLHYLIELFTGHMTVLTFFQYLAFSMLAVMIAMTVHEFAHSLAALAFGDETSKTQGRLSLNPFAHLDPKGLVCLLVFGIGFAKPVNVRQARMKHPRLGMIVTAAAGPLSNFITAFVMTFAYLAVTIQSVYVAPGVVFWENCATALFLILWYNISLGLFNLIPLPPLDGSKILGEMLPLNARLRYYSIERYSLFIIVGLIAILNRVDIIVTAGDAIVTWFASVQWPLVVSLF